MNIPIFQADAFTAVQFAGNPAAVCPLDKWLDDSVLQSIAAENNLSETAFFVREPAGYRLRWFTPKVEVDLCGHATLATAFVIMNRLEPAIESVAFETRSGRLEVRREGDLYVMDFPARPPSRCQVHPRLIEALGTVPVEILGARDYLAVYASADEVRTLEPNMELLSTVDRFAVIVTAPGTGDVDFVSRFFAPSKGVPEDPVTGSAHTTLVPYWAKRLGKKRLKARQISARGGELFCERRYDRVLIAGRAVMYLEGTIHIE